MVARRDSRGAHMKTSQALGLVAAAGACGLILSRIARTKYGVDFYGKSVVIFGGSRGLGLEIARQLAAEGAYLTLCAREAEELERARMDLDDRGFSATTIPCDIRDRRDVEAAIQRVVAEHGAIDVLINDASVMQVGPVELMTVADFEDAMATNFWGPVSASTAPSWAKRCLVSGRLHTSTSAADSFSTLAAGMRAGAITPTQTGTSMPGRPVASPMVGAVPMPGSAAWEKVPSTRALPLATIGSIEATLVTMAATCPPSRSVMAGAAPR